MKNYFALLLFEQEFLEAQTGNEVADKFAAAIIIQLPTNMFQLER
jgi:hypothetical protein